MRKAILIALLAIGLFQAACQPKVSHGALTIFAAASLTEAFTDIAGAYQAVHPGVQITFNFAGSQQLAQQLVQGAPADVFASANQAQMEAVVASGRIAPSSPRVFTRNRLVVIYPKENPAGLANIIDLAKPGVKLVLAAKEVPVGGYSLQFLEKASQPAGYGPGFIDQAMANVVSYEENVRAVYSKVALGEADAGIVYATDIPKDDPDGVGQIDIPAEWNLTAAYPFAVISDSATPELAASFVEFVLSTEGQGILAMYGFTRLP